MIIKSLSRKTASFKQLLQYLEHEKNQIPSWTNNLISNPEDHAKISREFLENSKFMSSKGRNFLYHEILSLHHDDATASPEVLIDLAKEYVRQRAPKALCYVKVHLDSTNQTPHCHIMLSGNELFSHKQISISKQRFTAIKKNVQQYQERKYPELANSLVKHGQHQAHGRSVQEEYVRERLKKEGKQVLKETMRDDITKLISQSHSMDELEKILLEHEYELYQRGKHFGVIYDGKKYRLKTLGIDEMRLQFPSRNLHDDLSRAKNEEKERKLLEIIKQKRELKKEPHLKRYR